MAFLFKSKQKSPVELVKVVREGIQRLNDLLGPYTSLAAVYHPNSTLATPSSPMAPNLPSPLTPGLPSASSVSSIGATVDKKAIEKVCNLFPHCFN